jgi:hypothetical protein
VYPAGHRAHVRAVQARDTVLKSCGEGGLRAADTHAVLPTLELAACHTHALANDGPSRLVRAPRITGRVKTVYFLKVTEGRGMDIGRRNELVHVVGLILGVGNARGPSVSECGERLGDVQWDNEGVRVPNAIFEIGSFRTHSRAMRNYELSYFITHAPIQTEILHSRHTPTHTTTLSLVASPNSTLQSSRAVCRRRLRRVRGRRRPGA